MKPGKHVTVAIHQPNLLPRLPTLAKIFKSDWWVVLDSVQFTQRDYQHRCWLPPLASRPAKQKYMEPQWLSLAVNRPDGRSSRIDTVTIVDPHLESERVARTLGQFYRRGADPASLDSILSDLTGTLDWSNHLTDVAEASTLALLRLLEWPGTSVRASSIQSSSDRSERLADLAARVGADTYLCGSGGARYLVETPFAERGVSVAYAPAVGARDAFSPDYTRATSLYTLMETGLEGLRNRVRQAGRFGPKRPRPATQREDETRLPGRSSAG